MGVTVGVTVGVEGAVGEARGGSKDGVELSWLGICGGPSVLFRTISIKFRYISSARSKALPSENLIKKRVLCFIEIIQY